MADSHSHACCDSPGPIPKAAVAAHDDCCGSDHGHDSADFNLRQELTPIAIAAILFLIGLIFNEALHNTPFAIAEYAVLIPAYLISG